MNHLQGLNEAQQKAVLHTNGPLLIVAGAGAGKTKVITHRILNLIKNGVAPEAILAVTFTNKAAREMRERLGALIENDRDLNLPISRQALRSPTPFVSTFHSLGVHILKENAALLNLSRHFSIFDRSDSTRAIKEAMKQEGIDPKQYEPRNILGIISRQKGNGTTASRYESTAANHVERIVAPLWKRYEKILEKERALDFDDLLLKTVLLLESHTDVLSRYHKTWSHLLIDEYQDTNQIQYRLSELLAGSAKNICVVGDIDQNIYSWRGATIENLLDFEKTYPGASIVTLQENYRSTKTILDVSNAIIEKNKNRLEKTLIATKEAGEQMTLYGGFNEEDEARFIVSRASELAQAGVPLSEIAVLYRTNFQSRALEEAFLYAGVPYQVLGTRFFERKEVKDMLAFLKVALSGENSADLARIVNAPARGIGKVTLLKMIEGRESELTPAMQKRVSDFRALLARIRSSAETRLPSETVRYVLGESGLEKFLIEGNEEDKERLLNIKELVTLATKYDALPPLEGIEKLLEDAALASDQDTLIKNEKAVKLMTIHASKGLEFDYVFITGLEEGLFPQRIDRNDRDEEEERRLFYVALTRARKKVFLTFASVRTIFGSREVTIPSEFISDIPERYLETEGYESSDSGLLTIE